MSAPVDPELGEEKAGPFSMLVRAGRHPLRVFALGLAAFSLLSQLIPGGALVAVFFAIVCGVLFGEALGASRVRFLLIGAGALLLGGGALLFAAATTALEPIVAIVGPGRALWLSAALRFGGLAFAFVFLVRAAAKRWPIIMALELGVVVGAIALAFAGHRDGVLIRPLWLSDWAWRRGLDPADLLVGVGIAAASLALTLLVLERRGRPSYAALAILPLFAIFGVSCLEVQDRGPDRGEASGETDDRDGDDPHDMDEGDPHDRGRGRADGGAGSDGGRAEDAGAAGGDGGLDGGVGEGPPDGGDGGASGGGDASLDGGGGGGGDGGADGGGGGGDGDGGLQEGGAGGGDGDGGTGGGGGDGGLDDGGGAGGDGGTDPWTGWDAGLTDEDIPPPQMGDESEGEGQSGGAVSGEDLFDDPPPTGESGSSPVAVVLFREDYSPPSEMYYFRQDAWSELRTTRLVPTSSLAADRDLSARMPSGRVAVDGPGPEGRLEVPTRVALLVPHPKPFALESPILFQEARNPNPRRFSQVYEVVSRAQLAPFPELLGRQAGDPDWSGELWALYTEPHADPRFAEFAEEAIAALPLERRDDPFARAVAIKLRLDELLTYSTRERHADAEDPTVDFFFGNRIGYCVHFAHTAVYLWRAVGVPSRIGVGYGVPEANRRGGSALVITSGDAHAWPELYLEGIGWVVLDIAARENLDPPGTPQDEDLQQLLGEMAREEPVEDPTEESIEEREERRAKWLAAARWLLLLLLVAFVVVTHSIKLWRSVRPLFASARAMPRVAHRAALDRLAEVGLRRDTGETREAFAKRVAELAPSFVGLTELLLRARLGPPGAEPERAAHREALRALRRELRGSTPLWRRLLGRLHPLSFLDSR